MVAIATVVYLYALVAWVIWRRRVRSESLSVLVVAMVAWPALPLLYLAQAVCRRLARKSDTEGAA